ncbi:metallophosphoesterase family protein [Clostridium chromiireducens]|uniref:3',5'-cyclic adenosine monophosphate phosphodiesterase CpdA n=1 Tax=Clostridium chromiireducens TaxID=225345 RepID=A0A1V4J187_9CLOT|nr:metallophosphoesterase [Clostridium chromiireducens]OPJ65919.1 3',5'-cyclic adenosine monophosphate phosphodiesterase CpdA [Clostridium chromiireducens]
MRKIKKVVISIILIIAGVAAVIYMNKPKPIDKSAASKVPDVDLAFAVLGDVHENIDSFQESINDLYKINPGMDALVLNGDTVDQGIEKQYDSVKKTINKNKDLLPKIIIKNIGNHEFFNYDIEVNSPEQVQTFINRYLEFAEEDKVYHDTWVKDYHFISLGSEDGNSETMNSITASISEEQQKWLKEKLAEKYQKGKPIFVFLHQPLNSGNGANSWVGVKQSDQVKEILSKYPEVILFSSHTHRDLDENSVVLNQPFTMVHTGAVHYTIIPDQGSEGGRRREPYIKGLYIEVNGDKVVIQGRNIKDKQWIFTKEISKE